MEGLGYPGGGGQVGATKAVDPFAPKPSSLDRMEAVRDHGTKAGYSEGCRGSHCPGVARTGMSCAQANIRYNGDLSYRRRIDGGLSPEAIWAEDQLEGTRMPKLTTRAPRVIEDSVSFEDSGEPLDDVDTEPVPGIDTVAAPSLSAPQAASVPSEPVSASGGRTAKWAVRKVWVAVAPDGTLHGPHNSREDVMVFLAEKLAPRKPKREPAYSRRAWTDGDTATMLALHGQLASASEIARQMDRQVSTVLRRLESNGLKTHGTRGGNHR